MADKRPAWELAVRFLILLVGPAAFAWTWFSDTGFFGGFVAGILMALAPVLAFGKWERPWILRPPSITGQG